MSPASTTSRLKGSWTSLDGNISQWPTRLTATHTSTRSISCTNVIWPNVCQYTRNSGNTGDIKIIKISIMTNIKNKRNNTSVGPGDRQAVLLVMGMQILILSLWPGTSYYTPLVILVWMIWLRIIQGQCLIRQVNMDKLTPFLVLLKAILVMEIKVLICLLLLLFKYINLCASYSGSWIHLKLTVLMQMSLKGEKVSISEQSVETVCWGERASY